MTVAAELTATPTRARELALRPWTPAPPARHAVAGGRWYDDAVFAALPSMPPAAIVDVPAVIDALQLFRSAGATAVLLPVPFGRIRPVHRSGPPICGGVGCLGLVQFERVLVETRAHGLRVLIDTRTPAPHQPHAARSVINAGRSWLRDGADGVVVADDAAHVLFACETAPADGVHAADWFTATAGVPVPVGDDRLAALAAFRADVPAAILEGIERGSAGPLLALLVELAVRHAREEEESGTGAARLESRVSAACCRAATVRSSLDGPRQRLFDRLLISLPGPLLLPCACGGEHRLGDNASTGGHSRRNEVAALIGERATCAAFRLGQPLPVSLGAGPALAWVSEFGHEVALVAANLSGTIADVQSDLNGYQGRRVLDMTRATDLPRVTDEQYRLTLQPFECRWLRLMAA